MPARKVSELKDEMLQVRPDQRCRQRRQLDIEVCRQHVVRPNRSAGSAAWRGKTSTNAVVALADDRQAA